MCYRKKWISNACTHRKVKGIKRVMKGLIRIDLMPNKLNDKQSKLVKLITKRIKINSRWSTEKEEEEEEFQQKVNLKIRKNKWEEKQ